MTTLLIVDDEPDFCDFVSAVAAGAGFDALVATRADEAKIAYVAGVPGLIVLDLMMPDMDGIELLRFLAENRCQAGVVLISGFDRRVLESASSLAVAQGLTVLGCFNKPLQVFDLERVFREYQPIRERVAAKYDFRVTRDALVKALVEDEMVVHYQPQIDLIHQRAVGVEALVRWVHPHHGMIFPDTFIDLVEEFGLMEALTRHVLRSAVAQHRVWLDQGFKMTLSVNVSASLLTDLSMPEWVLAMLGEAGIAPADLKLEVTEKGILTELVRSLDVLTRLRIKGVQLSIDDFGTGYATLQQTQRVPANEIKIDRSFVMSMFENHSAMVIVKSTIDLGHQLGMLVVAEGVESERHQRYLLDAGCDIAQGYQISRPISAMDMTRWLESMDQRIFLQ